ncbi:MAG: uroporphyrinogen decarboxylase family protein [Candidatus Aminicenantaceae bacterium]
MTSKQRFIAALEGRVPDRLPVTTHHVMPYFLEHYLQGISSQEFFDVFGLDPIEWVDARMPDIERGDYLDPLHEGVGYWESPRMCSDQWRIEREEVTDPRYRTVRYSIHTPGNALSMVLQNDAHTAWVTERLIKHKSDIDTIAEFAPVPICNVDLVNQHVENFGERGLIRGSIPSFDIYGQPGCWQDAAVLFGIEALILQTFDDPEWVHAFLRILQERKTRYIRSMPGARFDLLELGGGDASSTVISPRIFDIFVAPYDAVLIDEAHAAGQRVVYHTCGGMMPLLEGIADMGPDAAETFTPPDMGGDVDLAKAKRRIGDRLCLIGGFDQFHFFTGCTLEDTRKEVRRCFEAAGAGGGFILSPSDHFFDAEVELLHAYADEARGCRY